MFGCDGTKLRCFVTCSSDADCKSTAWCNAPSCIAKSTNGIGCTSDRHCLSGHCIDGYCCDDACVGACRACDLPGTVGTCTFVPSGQDPDNECAPGSCTTGSCAGDGTCGRAPDGTWCNDCESTCFDGICDSGCPAATVCCPDGFTCARPKDCIGTPIP